MSIAPVNWFPHFPEEPGNFLWIAMWGCDCCVERSGIAFVQRAADAVEPPLEYTNSAGEKLAISWEAIKPHFLDNNQPVIHWWMKLDLPVSRDDLSQPKSKESAE